MRFTRASGILLHPTSLAGPYGIGDLGSSAYDFIDWLVSAGQKLWQILPLGPTSYGNSPYSSYSAFAGNTLLISPELLVKEGLVRPELLNIAPGFAAGRVDYEAVSEWKLSLLNEAFETFKASSNSPLTDEFTFFRRENAWWLDDYAAFRAIKYVHDHSPWSEWAEPIRLRNVDALEQTRSQLAREIEAERFFQYLFFRQWLALKNYANSSGVQIIGDLPIFVAYDSADVWCNQSKFKLNPDGSPKVVSGVPPDYFSKTGQLWGNPIYDWEAMLRDNFNWWTARIAFSLRLNDIVRLDHFIGFLRNWEIPGEDETAENGVWADVPGRDLFAILRQRLGHLPIIAEDLGSVTHEVEELRDALDIPGMRILQYAFGGDSYNRDLPHNYNQNTVAYTGTHDNDTAAGWYRSAPKNVKAHCRRYLRVGGREMHWELIRACLASAANTAIIPAQDLLGLGSESRMNTPATASGNWEWRLKDDQLNEHIAERLRDFAAMFGRV